MRIILKFCVVMSLFLTVKGPGLLILYRPYDISQECSFSGHMRYDLSYGMGMSDTITLVFRTLNSADYECMVEIVADSPGIYLIIVIMYPNLIVSNCMQNPDAFAVLKKDKCFRLCDTITGRAEYTHYYVASVADRFRFRFASNSSINADMKAHMYQVTATSARMVGKDDRQCEGKNETICVNNGNTFCFTSGVVCDGIKNCGVADWFDERKADCGLPVEHLGFAPVFAVTAAILCAALAAGHLIMRCLPPLANSFFVFNANEDNRLCMDTVFLSPNETPPESENVPRKSLVPVSSSSSSSDLPDLKPSSSMTSDLEKGKTEENGDVTKGPLQSSHPVSTMRTMTNKIQDKIKAVANRGKSVKPKLPSGRRPFRIRDSLHV